MTGKERYEKLLAWMRERRITLRDVGEQLEIQGVCIEVNTRFALMRDAMGKGQRRHLLNLGFPEELLPQEGPGIGHKRRTPQWPNPEAARVYKMSAANAITSGRQEPACQRCANSRDDEHGRAARCVQYDAPVRRAGACPKFTWRDAAGGTAQ